jgi:hypothetical protein
LIRQYLGEQLSSNEMVFPTPKAAVALCHFLKLVKEECDRYLELSKYLDKEVVRKDLGDTQVSLARSFIQKRLHDFLAVMTEEENAACNKYLKILKQHYEVDEDLNVLGKKTSIDNK